MSAPRPPGPLDVHIRVNGRDTRASIEPRELLVAYLRDRLGLTGTKVSCDAQVCGTCTVLVDGQAVSSCAYLAADADSREVVTVEGVASPTGELGIIQQSFVDHAAFQCGYCTPGFLMTATALLAEYPHPSRAEIVDYLEGSICRCTGYVSIVEAILAAAHREADG